MKILIADDHVLFREGLSSFLKNLNEEAIIVHAENYSQALKVLEDNKIDFIVLDLDMPDMAWKEGLEKIKEKISDETQLVVMSALSDVKIVRKVLNSGAKGFIPKNSSPKIIESAINLVMSGGFYIPPEILDKCCIGISSINLPAETEEKREKSVLTHRQAEVLKYISSGLSNKQIAYELGVTESTIKLHINSLLRNLGVNNRTQAVITAQKLGLI